MVVARGKDDHVPPSRSVEDIELSLAPFLRSKQVRQVLENYSSDGLMYHSRGHSKLFLQGSYYRFSVLKYPLDLCGAGAPDLPELFNEFQ